MAWILLLSCHGKGVPRSQDRSCRPPAAQEPTGIRRQRLCTRTHCQL